VSIDKKTFNAYRASKSTDLGTRLQTVVKRTRSQASDSKYARIELTSQTGACSMLENRLCSIQKELGEDKLSNTCFNYPRKLSETGGLHQQALTLSCPEAARLALQVKEAFDISKVEITVRPETIERRQRKLGLSYDQMNEVRFFCIKLIRTEGLELWQKIAILGLFCESLTEALKTGGHNRVADIMATTKELMGKGETSELLEGMQTHYEVQAITFAMLWNSKNEALQSESQLEVNKSIARGLGADKESGDVSEAVLVERYEKGLEILPEVLKETPFFLENYILNEMWLDSFPFSKATPFENYRELVIRFGLVRFMLAAQCSQVDSQPSLKTMTKTVQTFCRRYQHDSQFSVNVNNCLKSAGWSDLNKLYIFLKA